MNQLRDSNRNFIVANNTKVSFVQDAFTAEAHALKQVLMGCNMIFKNSVCFHSEGNKNCSTWTSIYVKVSAV
jgi:hypothetical protein